MSDPLHHVLPADGQRTFEELREEFREANLQRIRRTLRKDSLVRYHRDGTVAGRLDTGLMTDAPVGRDWRTLRDYTSQGEAIPEFREEFCIPESLGLDRELRDLARDASALALHEGVRYPHDNPEGNTHADSATVIDAADELDRILKRTNCPAETQAPEPQQAGGGRTEGVGDTAGESSSGGE